MVQKNGMYSRWMASPIHRAGLGWAGWSVGFPGLGDEAEYRHKRGQIRDQWERKKLTALQAKPRLRAIRAKRAASILENKGFFGRFIGPLFTAYQGYEGYKEGGAWGAFKSMGEGIAENYLFGAATKAFFVPTLVAGGALAAGYLGAKVLGDSDPGAFLSLRGWARPWTQDYRREHKNLDFGSPSVDPFGINGTMRQRSLVAIQNSRLNARSALGSEAYRTHFR